MPVSSKLERAAGELALRQQLGSGYATGEGCPVVSRKGERVTVDCGVAGAVQDLVSAGHVTYSSCSGKPSEHKTPPHAAPGITILMPPGDAKASFQSCMDDAARGTKFEAKPSGNYLFIERKDRSTKPVLTTDAEADRYLSELRGITRRAGQCARFLPWARNGK